MYTKTRIRGEAPFTLVERFPSAHNSVIYYSNYGSPTVGGVTYPEYIWSGFPQPYHDLPYTTLYSESIMADVVLDFSRYPKSQHKALRQMIADPKSLWRRTFKNCHNFTKWYRTTKLPDEKHSLLYVNGYQAMEITSGGWYDNYIMTHQGGDPIEMFLNNNTVKELTGVADWQLAVFVEKAQSDAALLALKSFSIANFIAELRDVKKLVDIFKFNMRKPLESAAEQNLLWQFGVFPLIGDLKAIYDIFMNLDYKIKKWNEMALSGLVMNQHAKHATPDDVITNFSFRHNDPWNAFSHSDLSADIESVTRYHIYYTADHLPELQEDDLLRSLLGLGNIGSIIWEALPWSFLIDYVYNVGDVIEQWTNSDPILSVNIKTFGYSRKLTLNNLEQNAYIDRIGYNILDLGLGAPLNKLSFSRVGYYDSYERVERDVASLPDTSERSVGEFQLGNFNGRKASIVASLGILYRR